MMRSGKLLKQVQKRAPNLDLDTYGRHIGRIAESAEQAIPVIEAALAEPHREREIRRAMASHVFHEPGGAADRVARVILHAAGLAERLPDDVEELIAEAAFGAA